jgi:hypothetical protein
MVGAFLSDGSMSILGGPYSATHVPASHLYTLVPVASARKYREPLPVVAVPHVVVGAPC